MKPYKFYLPSLLVRFSDVWGVARRAKRRIKEPITAKSPACVHVCVHVWWRSTYTGSLNRIRYFGGACMCSVRVSQKDTPNSSKTGLKVSDIRHLPTQ